MVNFCKKLCKLKLSNKEIKSLQKKFYDYLKKNVIPDNKFIVTSNIVKQTFYALDYIYFKNQISKRIKKTNSSLAFSASKRLTSTAGVCKYKLFFDFYGDFDYGEYEISISKPIIDVLFADKKIKSLKINGLHCFDRLECYISLFQHEVIHLVIGLFCHEEGQCDGGHTTTFKQITKNLFGHTEYRHMLLCGDSLKLEKDEKENKQKLKIGDYIVTKTFPKNKKVYEGFVYFLSDKHVYFNYRGTKYRVEYKYVDKTKKISKKEKEKYGYFTGEEIKNKLKVNMKVKFKLDGKIKTCIILKLNNKKARVRLGDKSEWDVPYELFIL